MGRVFAWLLLESTRVDTGSALLDRRMEILLLLLDTGSHPAVREASTQQVRGEERERERRERERREERRREETRRGVWS